MKVSNDVLINTYASLLVMFPLYPFFCVLNEIGGTNGIGYYNFIPQFMLPHDQRPNSSQTKWPGLKFHPIF